MFSLKQVALPSAQRGEHGGGKCGGSGAHGQRRPSSSHGQCAATAVPMGHAAPLVQGTRHPAVGVEFGDGGFENQVLGRAGSRQAAGGREVWLPRFAALCGRWAGIRAAAVALEP